MSSHGDEGPQEVPEFEAATSYVASLATGGEDALPSQSLLQFYGLYKQGVEGDCGTDKPSIFNPGARAKWAAWKQLAATPRTQAQAEYVALLRRLRPEWQPPAAGSGGGGQRAAVGPVFSSLAGTAVQEGVQMDAAELPLHDAASRGDEEAVQRQLAGGAAVDAQDEEGCSPLHWAADKGHVQVIHLLVRHGADVNAQDADGLTPLHYAALAEQRQAAEALLQSGADAAITNAEGEAAKDIGPPSWTFLA